MSGNSYVAALPWSTLPQALLDRMLFFHHARNGRAPGRAEGAGAGRDSRQQRDVRLAARVAAGAGAGHGADEPIVLGPRNIGEDVTYQGQPQPIFSPSTLAALLAPPTGPSGQLPQLRDNDLNRLNAWVKTQGNGAQAAFIDQYVQSQAQARSCPRASSRRWRHHRQQPRLAGDGGGDADPHERGAGHQHQHPVRRRQPRRRRAWRAKATQQVAGVATLGKMWQELFAAGNPGPRHVPVAQRLRPHAEQVRGRGNGPAAQREPPRRGRDRVAVPGGPVGGVAADVGRLSARRPSTRRPGLPVPRATPATCRSRQTFSALGLTVGTGVGVDTGFLARTSPAAR